MGIGQDESTENGQELFAEEAQDIKTYDDLTASDGGISVELKKKRVRKTVIGELKEANEYIALLKGYEARAEEKAAQVGAFAQCVTIWLTVMVAANIGLVIALLIKKAGG